MTFRSIVINGDLGSGKSTVAAAVAAATRTRLLSIGDLHRQLAKERGLSALELNLQAETDEAVDNYIDSFQIELSKSEEPLIVDSRLAWFFFENAFKVHLITDPDVAAHRVLSRPTSGVESYTSLAEARSSLFRRSESERVRFLNKYKTDKELLRNYHLIVDTTAAQVPEVTQKIIDCHRAATTSDVRPAFPVLMLDPRRVYPTDSVQSLRGLWDENDQHIGSQGYSATEAISVGYTGEYFYVLDGHRRLSLAIGAKLRLLPALLRAERSEDVIGGINARQYFESELTLPKIYDWDAAHNLDLPLPPHLAKQVSEALAEQNGH